MKLLRLITRRRVKWTGTLIASALFGLVIASIWIEAVTFHPTDDRTTARFISICRGGVSFGWSFSDLGWPDDSFHSSIRLASVGPFVWIPSHETFGPWSMETEQYEIPLWPVVLLIAAPTAWLFYTDCRAKPWQCAKCRYDLCGLEGGVCPECGAE